MTNSMEKRIFARAVGSYVPKLTKKVFEKYGFSTADLLTNWAQIVGTELAACTLPQRLKWPRRAHEHVEGHDDHRQANGATLVLRVDGGRALDVQYQGRQIVERINTYFGYAAIKDVRIVQAPLEDACPRRTPIMKTRQPLPKSVLRAQPKPHIAGVRDDGLRSALERLGASILADKSQQNA